MKLYYFRGFVSVYQFYNFSHCFFSAAKELKKTQKATTKKSAPAAAAPKAAKAAKAAQKAQKPMQKAAPRVGGKR